MSRITLLILFLSTSLFSQTTLRTKSKKAIGYYQDADNYRVRRQYSEAIDLLREAIKKDDKFVEAYIRLANIYHTTDQLALAEVNYNAAIELAPNYPNNVISYFSIAEIQITLEKYEDAKTNVSKYLSFNSKENKWSAKAKLLLTKANYALENRKKSISFEPSSLNTNVNQFAMQYFPVVTADQNTLLYTKRDGNSPYDDEDIMVSKKNKDGDWGMPESISSNINSKLNEGTCSISADGRTLVFTSCQGREGFGSCDLFISHKNGGKWSLPINMGASINSSAWESQPSLSADGRKLFFVSNRSGGLGGRDIWVSTLSNGKWTTPNNLGSLINTPYEEVSPFIHPNNQTLYFASNGMPGYGGFDVYSSEQNAAKEWSAAKNIGYPINRGNNQMSLVIDANGEKGYYSENSEEGVRFSEIKEFLVPEEMLLKFKSQYAHGVVLDSKTTLPLKAKVQLFDLVKNELIGEISSDSVTGEYLVVITEGEEYALYFNKQGYVFQSENIDFKNKESSESIEINVKLNPISCGATAILNNVFFDHDSYQLNPESLIELNKVATFIKENDVRLEIGGYTDASGAVDYNLVLSQKRAEAVYLYLTQEENIPLNALTYKGYGQDGSKDFANLHLARRIEFRVLSLKSTDF